MHQAIGAFIFSPLRGHFKGTKNKPVFRLGSTKYRLGIKNQPLNVFYFYNNKCRITFTSESETNIQLKNQIQYTKKTNS